jgi:hypothetical protein
MFLKYENYKTIPKEGKPGWIYIFDIGNCEEVNLPKNTFKFGMTAQYVKKRLYTYRHKKIKMNNIEIIQTNFPERVERILKLYLKKNSLHPVSGDEFFTEKKEYIKKIILLIISFDVNQLDDTYDGIFELIKKENLEESCEISESQLENEAKDIMSETNTNTNTNNICQMDIKAMTPINDVNEILKNDSSFVDDLQNFTLVDSFVNWSLKNNLLYISSDGKGYFLVRHNDNYEIIKKPIAQTIYEYRIGNNVFFDRVRTVHFKNSDDFMNRYYESCDYKEKDKLKERYERTLITMKECISSFLSVINEGKKLTKNTFFKMYEYRVLGKGLKYELDDIPKGKFKLNGK